MNAKELKLVEFIEKCEEQGLSDMSDPTQSLKAKVIAKDLGVSYKDIAATWQDAVVAKEKKHEEDRIAEEQRIEEERIAEERRIEAERIAKEREERLSKPGELLFTIKYGKNDYDAFEIYCRDDGSFYSTMTHHRYRIEGRPTFKLKKGGVTTTKIHPSKLVYTGATVGGVTTGGFHTTEAYRTERAEYTGTGSIEVNLRSDTHTVEDIVLSSFMLDRFKRDPRITEYLDNGVIHCSKEADPYLGKLVAENRMDMDLLTRWADSTRISKYECERILLLINDILNRKWPKSDAQICKNIIENIPTKYSRAFKTLTETEDLAISAENAQLLYSAAEDLCNSDSHIEIGHGTELLSWLLTHVDPIKDKKILEQLLQDSKERAILVEEEYVEDQRKKQEEYKKQRKKQLPKKIAVTVLIIALAIAGGVKYKQYSEYKAAEAARLEKEAAEAAARAEAEKVAKEKAAAEAAAKKAEEEKAALEAKKYDWSVVSVGDIKILGKYEQDNNTANGPEEIEWIVLEKKDTSALVISKYVLDAKPYNTTLTDVTWATCSLRAWLNESFIDTAFLTEERAKITRNNISADDNPKYSPRFYKVDPGKDSEDSIFLLSTIEAGKYFSSNRERKGIPTPYCKAQGVYGSDGCWWWLRTYGNKNTFASTILTDGDYNNWGETVESNKDGYKIGVRPVMWVSY